MFYEYVNFLLRNDYQVLRLLISNSGIMFGPEKLLESANVVLRKELSQTLFSMRLQLELL